MKLVLTEEQREVFRQIGSLGGKQSAKNMTARQRRERAMKAVNSPKSIAWREAVAQLARERAR
jgi:hypothetical protein